MERDAARWCECPPETPARLIGDEAYCNVCDEQVRPKADAANPQERDPFANDVLERLAKSNQHYQRSHGHYIVPLAERLLAARGYLAEIKKLASDPFASDAVALRACLLAANEALGLPGPQPSPEREIARAIMKEVRDAKP